MKIFIYHYEKTKIMSKIGELTDSNQGILFTNDKVNPEKKNLQQFYVITSRKHHKVGGRWRNKEFLFLRMSFLASFEFSNYFPVIFA